MTKTLSELVDAIADDLEGLSLPAHTVWKYSDPPVIRSDVGPILGVFPRSTDYTLLATNSSYENAERLVVAWWEPLIASAETGGAGDQAIAQAALATSLKIEAQLRTYGVAVPGFADENEATLEQARYGIIVGTTTWAAEFTLKVTRWPT